MSAQLVLVCCSATGSIASISRSSCQVGFTPDSGHTAATQRNDVMGQQPTLAWVLIIRL